MQSVITYPVSELNLIDLILCPLDIDLDFVVLILILGS